MYKNLTFRFYSNIYLFFLQISLALFTANLKHMTQTHFRTCNLCEAICGLEITLENNIIETIKGDKNDLFSRGHICPKALALKDVHADPDRLKFPMKKTASGHVQISWEEAFDIFEEKIKGIQAAYGHNAVAMYQGNPSIHNLGTTLFSPSLSKALKSKNQYTATSTDQLPHHFASNFMYGHPMLLPVPDIDHTDFMLILGANPLASNGSMMTVPDVAHRLKEIQNRGGKFIVIDPRKTETAAKADAHYFMRPGTDVYFLLAILHVFLKDNLVKLGHLESYTQNVAKLETIAHISPQIAADICGIPAQDIIEISHAFASAQSGVIYGRMGVSVQSNGGLCQHLIQVLNILSGNLDRQGGAMFASPLIDYVARSKNENRYNRWQSNVSGRPEFMGELPVSVLAEEIEANQIKALIVSCGNPVLSIPNGKRFEAALSKIDFIVSIDIYLNETSCQADLILPPATGLEVDQYDLTFSYLSVRNNAKYSHALFAPVAGGKYDYEIYQELAYRLSPQTEPLKIITPKERMATFLQGNNYEISLETLLDAQHGIDLGPLKPVLPGRLPQGFIDIFPHIFTADYERVLNGIKDRAATGNTFHLIGRRHVLDNNSWLHNSHRLTKGPARCTLFIHPTDAKELDLNEKDSVKIHSRIGTELVAIEINAEIMPGVVSLPHGYGHNRKGTAIHIAQEHAGISINDLTDEKLMDPLTGNAAFSDLRVTLEKCMD